MTRPSVSRLRSALLVLAASGLAAAGIAQTMSIEEYDPKSTLVVPEHHPLHAKFPFVDVHNHQDRDQSAADVKKLVSDMDRLNMRVMVNLSGSQGAEFEKGYANLAGRYPGRFIVFANLDFSGIEQPGWGQKAAAQLALDYQHGARGLKIFKNLGMTVTEANGKRVAVDDPRLDPVWDKAGELGIPVLIHTAEPHPFFEPQDKYNERWLELKQFPQRARPPSKYPPFETLMTERNHLFAMHPRTKFIAAHLGFHGNDLARLGRLFDEHPNVYVDIAAVLAELGRQPYSAHDFLTKYQDRVLMGKDIYEVNEYKWYFRCLETHDEYIEYYRKRHAFWKMYGLALPDEILKKIYYKNALKVIPGIDPKSFPP